MSPLLTVKQLSKLLNIRGSTLYSWVAQEKIPHVKIHGLIRFQLKDIDDWLLTFSKVQLPIPNIPVQKMRNLHNREELIAQVQREIYNASRGKPDHGRPRKEESHGI